MSGLDDGEGDAQQWGRCHDCGAARAVRVVMRSESQQVTIPTDNIPVGSAWPELILTERWCPVCGQVG